MKNHTTCCTNNIIEEWRNVVGFEGCYLVSNLGRIMRIAVGRGVKPGTIRHPGVTRCGYLTATLCENGKKITKGVHRWVAEAFLGPCPDGYEINHKNGDKKDNRAENLEWVTKSQNQRHSYRVLGRNQARGEQSSSSILTNEDVIEIRRLAASGHSRREIAAMFKISNCQVSNIVNRKQWAHLK